MIESVLKKLKWEVGERKLERKVEAFKIEQIEKERAKHKAIYVELLASHAPTVKETIIFEQKQRSRELEEELETKFDSLKKTTTSIATLAPQVIIISDLEEEVEIIPQQHVEEQPELVLASRPVEEEELQQPIVEERTKQVSASRPMEKGEL